MEKTVLVIGAGGVGEVVVQKCAQNNDILGNICIASRTVEGCDAIIEEVYKKNNVKDQSKELYSKALSIIDDTDTESVVNVIKEVDPNIVINAAIPECNMPILDACLETGVAYIDTSCCDEEFMEYPWYEGCEWARKSKFKEKGLTAVLSVGFDPGIVNAYCAYAVKHHFDKIDTIDILDVNAGDHGKFFATNFNPETNLTEILEDAGYWEDGEYKECKHHTISRTYDFPVVGEHKVYIVGHDEIHSLPTFIDANSIRFWMGFSDHYINCFNVLKNCGLLNWNPITLDVGKEVVPLEVLAACLPDPTELAPNYTGLTCIGNLIKGEKDGKEKEIFIYNTCDHQECYKEVGSQAISYTAGVPAAAAAILIAEGVWDVKTMVNVEELDPDPFLDLLKKMGLPTRVKIGENDVEL